MAVLQFSREVAFATAHVYASFAENRGAWDARLEALVVDALVRGERSDELSGRAAALGWATTPRSSWWWAPPGRGGRPARASAGRPGRCAARCSWACTPSSSSSSSAATTTWRAWPSGSATSSATARWSPARSSTAWARPASPPRRPRRAAGRPRLARAPRPVAADALLAERALDGDPLARAALHERVAGPLQAAGGEVLETVRAVLNSGGNLEASARAIFVHPNTVRYRLKRAADLTGLSATDPRGSWTLQVALALAQLDQRPLPLALSPASGACGPHLPDPRERGRDEPGSFGGFLQRSAVCFRAARRPPNG